MVVPRNGWFIMENSNPKWMMTDLSGNLGIIVPVHMRGSPQE